MRKSSATQQAFDFYTTGAADPNEPDAVAAAVRSAIPIYSSSAPFKFPDFGRYDAAYAATSRIAGRINAANISDAEHGALRRERQRLLDKKLDGTITRKEANRLEYVRWSLDRIEDAKHGPSRAKDGGPRPTYPGGRRHRATASACVNPRRRAYGAPSTAPERPSALITLRT